MQFIQDIVVTGGELSGRIADGQVTDLQFVGPLQAAYTFNDVSQNFGLVTDFGADIEFEMFKGSNVHIQTVPEPSVVLMVALGTLWMVPLSRRKRR